MHIEGSYDFEFEREPVWDVLMDIPMCSAKHSSPARRACRKSARTSMRAN